MHRDLGLPRLRPDASCAFNESTHSDAERWWLDRFAGPIPSLDLPFDSPRPPVRTYRPAREDHVLDAPLVTRLTELATTCGASFQVTLLAGFEALLHRLSGERDLVVGILSNGRATSDHPELMAHCVDTLPVRCQVDGAESFRTLTMRVRIAVHDATEHSEYTLGSLLHALPLHPDPSRPPLVSVLFNLEREIDAVDLHFEELDACLVSNPRTFENFDLSLNAVEASGELRLQCQYNSDLLEPPTVRRWLRAFEVLMRAAADDSDQAVDRMAILTEWETEQFDRWNDTAFDYPRKLQVHELVERQAERHPGAIAVVAGSEQLSYGELDRRANRLARRLRALGVGRGVLVGIHLERSLDLPVAVLAVSKSGGAYVPLDPTYPRERIDVMIRDSRMALLVTEESVRELLPRCPARVLSLDRERAAIALESDAPLSPAEGASPEDVLYTIYTSGSTGTPKGVMVPHRAVVNLLADGWRQPGIGAGDVVLAVTTLSFDIAVYELWLPLSAGARVVLASREVGGDGERLLTLMRSCGATLLQGTPATWRLLLAAGWSEGDRLRALCGGEALPRDLAEQLVARAVEVWNMYGPTETTVWSSHHRVRDGGPVRIGGPIGNTSFHILDELGQKVPVGVPGELHIGGHGVSLGYHERPELTAERFVPDPFRTEPGARMYRTGDVARWCADGSVEYLGRRDDQVKVRGHRIELGEIEAALTRHAAVAQAVAAAREDRPGDARLIAYVVLHPGATCSGKELRRHVERLLPDYMVPQRVERLVALPLTPNGKVDRRRLPAVQPGGSAEVEYVGPRSDAEALLAGIWQDVLGIARIGIRDDFFHLGGHSLLAAQAVSRLARDHGVSVPLRQMFETPTIAGFAPFVNGPRTACPIPRRTDGRSAPATVMQRRLWLLDQLGLGRAASLPEAWRLRGRLDPAVLGRALDAFVRRHEATRTTLRQDGDELVQVVAPTLELDLTPVDLAAHPVATREAELQRRLGEVAAEPFDLAAGPLFRVRLFRLDQQEHVLALVPHHCIWDGWSFDVCLRELDETYRAFSRGESSPLVESPLQYADFATWHRGWLEGPEVADQVGRLRESLAGGVTPLELPTDGPRPRIAGEGVATEWITIPRPQADLLAALGRQHGATLFMVLLAAFETLLHRYSGQDDFLVGLPVQGRTRAELEDVVGLLMKDVVVRARFDADPGFVHLLGHVRATLLDAFSNQDAPLESVGVGRHEFYRAFFSFEDGRGWPAGIGDLERTRMPMLAPATATDVGLWMMDTADGLLGGLNYRTELFDGSTMRGFLRSFDTLLTSILEDPSRPVSSLPLVGLSEQAIGDVSPCPRRPVSAIHARFEAQAASRPTALALVSEHGSMTYGELDASAGSLARRLRRLEVGPGHRVAICSSPGPDRVVALLAVAKAGGASVPLDPVQPPERLRRILDDSGASVILVGPGTEAVAVPAEVTILSVDAGARDVGPDGRASTAAASPNDAALVAYTSGPHGAPLGVELCHAVLSSTVDAVREATGLSPHDRFVATVEVSSGRSVLEVLLALGTGSTLICADAADAGRLREVAENCGATAMHADPEVWQRLIDTGWSAGSGFLTLSSGAAVSPRLAAELAARTGRAYSLHGMAESGFWSGLVSFDDATAPGHLGKPLGDRRWHVVDRRLQPVPPGVPGELLVGGRDVACGYLGDPEPAATRFLPDAWSSLPPARLVRTGDRVRVREGNAVTLLGVENGRLAVHGLRVEAVEVEDALGRHPAVREAAVTAFDQWGERRLMAHIVNRPGQDYTHSELRRHLRLLLPDHMVPRRFVEVDGLPRHADGSLDRTRLATISDHTRVDAVEPRTEGERLLAALWRDALDVTAVGVHDNFFDLGGHSLLCIQVIAQLERRTGRRLSPRLLLLNTLEQVAAQLEAAVGTSPAGGARVR